MDDGTRVKADNWRKLRYVSAALMKLPPLCVTVKLRSPAPESGSVKINYLYHKKGSLPPSTLSFMFYANIFSPGYPVVELAGASSEVLSGVDTITEKVLPVNDNSRASSLVIGETQRLKVLHVESPREVFFMRSSDRESFCQLHEKISKEAERFEFQPDFRPGVGFLVLVKASDGHWYRGEILSIESPVHLRFYAVDFGFTELVKRKRVREIPGTLSTVKTQHYFGEIF